MDGGGCIIVFLLVGLVERVVHFGLYGFLLTAGSTVYEGDKARVGGLSCRSQHVNKLCLVVGTYFSVDVQLSVASSKKYISGSIDVTIERKFRSFLF